MKIVFMGTPEFAVPSLEILESSHHEIISVVTVPDKPGGRGLEIMPSAVKKFALSRRLRILQPGSLKEKQFADEIRSLNPDLIAVVAFRILPKEIFSLPVFGSFNLHASLLPKYRGAAPINWAIINGEKETGVTTFFLEEKVDTGKIIIQNRCEITDDDNAGTLHDKLADLGAKAVLSTVSLIEMTGGNVPVYAQDESQSCPAPKIFKEQCRIKWDSPAREVHNFIRGLSPYPGAYSLLNGKVIKVYKTSIDERIHNPGRAGSVFVSGGLISIQCADTRLGIKELQLEGRKRMTSDEFLRGFRMDEGAGFD